MSIIEELYYGEIEVGESASKNISQYIKIISANDKELNDCLDDNEKKLYSQIINAKDQIISEECKDSFVEGWKLGARFVLDTFVND